MKINTADKIFKFVYVWFLVIVAVFSVYMMTVLVISPKNDLKNRGFIACTKKLVYNLGNCQSGQIGCVSKAFYHDTACNSKVICKGFVKWVKGEQSTPWANYIFEPVWQEVSENPYLSDVENDMKNMELEREFMLKKQQELENIKNKALNVDKNVIISDPEAEFEQEIEISKEVIIEENSEQNIDDEADIGEIKKGNENEDKIEELPEPLIKSDSDKIAEKAKKNVLK